MTVTEHKFIGKHIDDLADGRVLIPGLTVELTDDQLADPHNVARINEGLLIPTQVDEHVEATDEAKALAEANGINLHDVTGTGQNGRIVKGDIETYIANKEGKD